MKGTSQRWLIHIIMTVVIACVSSCSSTKHVPDGELLLDKVSIHINNDSINVTELYNFLRQTPNHKALGVLKLQLATYNLSGQDTTKWYNRWLKSLGQPPVIYDADLAEKSRRQLEQVLINRGYMDVDVKMDSATTGKKKVAVKYDIFAGRPHVISSISYNIPDAGVARVLAGDSTIFSVKPGTLFDRTNLDDMRTRITERLRNNGYYNFNKDYISFVADTIKGSKDIALTLNIKSPQITNTSMGNLNIFLPDSLRYEAYRIHNVYFVTDFNPQTYENNFKFDATDTVYYKNIIVLYGKDHYIKPSILEEKCYIIPNTPYGLQPVERTYEALAQLGILKFINISMRPIGKVDGVQWLDAYILLSRNKKQAISFEVEGTNSEGDLGFGVGVTYQHRNLAHGSELLTVKYRTSYESLSGNFDGLVNNNYTEHAGEVGITFPKFMFPFMPGWMKKRMRSATEFALSTNYQERPEYTRIIAGAAWKYKWSRTRNSGFKTRHEFDLIDINYVKLPKSTLNFLDSIAPTNPLLRYSYEDHFIMRMGYTFVTSNKRIATGTVNAFAIQPSVSSLRISGEIAGNLLYGISSMLHQRKDDGAYKIFGIQYAQYVKAEADYSYTINMNSRNAIAMHIGGGIAVPYLNSKMVPFEKRFYAGGANGVRGWNVRTLGPGSYDTRNSVTNFINQCGDILLNLNVEYRAKLFWVLEGAGFIDAGNIWTIRDYINQPGGVFKFNKFYKQLAASYGLGLRLDFTYFLLRFDLGIKAHNPAHNQDHWPLIHPNWNRDVTLHFAVGYPF